MKKGSATIEASIIFPLLFLCIIAFISICLILYQQVVLQAKANEIAISIENHELGELKQELKEEGLIIDIDIRNRFIYKEANIILSRDYPMRLGRALKIFGFSNNYLMKASAKAVIKNQISFIRNTDFVIETLSDSDYLIGKRISQLIERINDL